jgi:hypothetical protein
MLEHHKTIFSAVHDVLAILLFIWGSGILDGVASACSSRVQMFMGIGAEATSSYFPVAASRDVLREGGR